MKKIIALVSLLIVVLGLAHYIEITVRPDTGRQGVQVQGEEHSH